MFLAFGEFWKRYRFGQKIFLVTKVVFELAHKNVLKNTFPNTEISAGCFVQLGIKVVSFRFFIEEIESLPYPRSEQNISIVEYCLPAPGGIYHIRIPVND